MKTDNEVLKQISEIVEEQKTLKEKHERFTRVTKESIVQGKKDLALMLEYTAKLRALEWFIMDNPQPLILKP